MNTLEQISFNTRTRMEVEKLINFKKLTQEEQRFTPLMANHKIFVVALTFLLGCNRYCTITEKFSPSTLLIKTVTTQQTKFYYHTAPVI